MSYHILTNIYIYFLFETWADLQRYTILIINLSIPKCVLLVVV